MRIIKPYGRSETGFEGKKKLRRAIRRKSNLGTPNDIPNDIVAFATTHPELVIAQWISAIDKIAAKPRGTHKPTPEQRALRQRLGEAAWQLLDEEKPSGGLFPKSGQTHTTVVVENSSVWQRDRRQRARESKRTLVRQIRRRR